MYGDTIHHEMQNPSSVSKYLKWNSYIQSIAKDAEKMVDSLYRSSKYQTLLAAMLYFYKSDQVKKKKWSAAIIPGLDLPSLHSTVFIEFKSVYAVLWVMNYFRPLSRQMKYCKPLFTLSIFSYQVF